MSTIKRVSVSSEDGSFTSFEMDWNLPLSMIGELVAVELNIPPEQQEFYLDGKYLSPEQTLISHGLTESSIILVRRKGQQQPQQQQQQQQAPPLLPQQQMGAGGQLTPQLFQQMMDNALSGAPAQPTTEQQLEQNPAALLQALRNDQDTLGRIMMNNPPLYEAIMSNDVERFKKVMDEQKEIRERVKREHQERMQRVTNDPLHPDNQKYIQEQIQQQNVDSNMQQALEQNPESFGHIVMLYIECLVNGVPVKVFVDSGAQSTIMSTECAQRCNIMHLVDRRFSGIAKGVGTAKIIGRVHMADLQIGASLFTSSFTIMENQSIDMLLGLDMLRRHQSCIDLKENVLRIGNEVAPFLAEKDIPRDFDAGNLRSSADALPSDPSSVQDQQQPQPSPQQPPAPRIVPSSPQSVVTPQGGGEGGGGQDSILEGKIRNLMSVTGRSRADVIRVLELCGGNEEVAASQLLFG